jgi:hypothetical protein
MLVSSISLDLPSYAFVVMGEPFVGHVFGTHDQLFNATLFLFFGCRGCTRKPARAGVDERVFFPQRHSRPGADAHRDE